MAGPRVAFYVLADAAERGRQLVACRLAEKAYQQGHRVVVRLGGSGDLRGFDELLWTFGDGSFVPHEVAPPLREDPAPVLVVAELDEELPADVLVNLGEDLPPGYPRYGRVAEIIGADAASRRAGRDRFRAYREQGIEPETHNLGGG